MKNKFIWLVIIALVAVIGFMFTTCNDDDYYSSGGNNSGNSGGNSGSGGSKCTFTYCKDGDCTYSVGGASSCSYGYRGCSSCKETGFILGKICSNCNGGKKVKCGMCDYGYCTSCNGTGKR